jgi:hypothetical protein
VCPLQTVVIFKTGQSNLEHLSYKLSFTILVTQSSLAGLLRAKQEKGRQ